MWLIFVFASISDTVSSPSLSFGVEQGVWLQDEVGSHWEIVGALAAFKCVGARETCCQATTAPLSFCCDDDALHISYAQCWEQCAIPGTVSYIYLNFVFDWCVILYVQACLRMQVYFCAFVSETGEKWVREDAPPPTQQAFRPHGWLPKTLSN